MVDADAAGDLAQGELLGRGAGDELRGGGHQGVAEISVVVRLPPGRAPHGAVVPSPPMGSMRHAFPALLVLLAAAALAGRIHYDDADLKTAVRQAGAVVVAKPAEPPQRKVKIDITPKGKKPDAEKFPPYTRVLTRWEVVEVLQAEKRAGLAPKKVIEVDDADFSSQLDLHRRYYLEGVSKSPIYQRYAPRESKPDEPRRILFLEQTDGQWRFAMDGAAESLDARADVEAALAAKDKE